VLRPSIKSSSVVHFPYLTSVSIAQALEKTLSLSPELKWPNDLLINSKKFCGVLSEIEFHKNEINFIIIGIGINVMQDVTDFSSQTLTNATSLYIELHKYIDRVNLLSEILFHFEKNYIHIIENGFSSILEEWQIRCPFIGRKIKINRDGETLNGIFRRLDNSGSLILELDDKSEMKIFAGDFNL